MVLDYNSKDFPESWEKMGTYDFALNDGNPVKFFLDIEIKNPTQIV